MLGKSTNAKKIVLLLGDIILLYLSLFLALSLRYGQLINSEIWTKHWLPFSFIFFIWIIIFFINKLYELSLAKNNAKFYSTLGISLAWCAVVGVIFFYIITIGISPKTILAMNIIIFAVLFSVWRHFFNRIIISQKFLANVLFIGLSKDVLKLAEEIISKPQLGLTLSGIINLDNSIPPDNSLIVNNIIKLPENLKYYLQQQKIKIVVIAADKQNSQSIINTLYGSLDLNITIIDLPSFAETSTGKILINTIGQIWFLENLNEADKKSYESIKRLFDILLSFLLLIISIPFLPFIILAIKTNSPGPVFFKQQRTGKHGKKFMAVKFRSMKTDAETSGPQWAVKNDPRVTRVGKFLRKSRIDEIPQLINVIRGEMSFIGPRPERPEFIAQLKEKIPFYETRLLVKPGITGWAQTLGPNYGGSEEETLEKLQYDLYYIKNRSLALDISILLKTIKTVLSGDGQ